MSDDPSPVSPRHIPVLPAEVLQFVEPAPGKVVVDATVGAGGHARLLGEKLGTSGFLIGIDQDPFMLELARRRLEGVRCRSALVHADFRELQAVLENLGVAACDAVLADLGVCSDQLDDVRRGLTFQSEGPLDMRLDRTSGVNAGEIVNRCSERDLADLFWRYGEERFSRRIARKIVAERRMNPFASTTQLAKLVRGAIPRRRGSKERIDPATRVFQALRIAVNDELGALQAFLKVLPRYLKPGGHAVIISFHSLEDRLVKQAFQDRTTWLRLTKKPVQATDEERQANPRSRSAKLRAAERTAVGR